MLSWCAPPVVCLCFPEATTRRRAGQVGLSPDMGGGSGQWAGGRRQETVYFRVPKLSYSVNTDFCLLTPAKRRRNGCPIAWAAVRRIWGAAEAVHQRGAARRERLPLSFLYFTCARLFEVMLLCHAKMSLALDRRERSVKAGQRCGNKNGRPQAAVKEKVGGVWR